MYYCCVFKLWTSTAEGDVPTPTDNLLATFQNMSVSAILWLCGLNSSNLSLFYMRLYFLNYIFFYRHSKMAVIMSINPPSRCCEFGTVHNVKRHCPPHVSLWWVRVHSCRTKGVYQLCNPPCESGCWGIHKVVGSLAWLCHHREMNAI